MNLLESGAIDPEIVWQLANRAPQAASSSVRHIPSEVIDAMLYGGELSAPAGAAGAGAVAKTVLGGAAAPLGIAGLLAGATLGGEAYQNYKRDRAIAEQNRFAEDMRNIARTPAQFVAEGENKPTAVPQRAARRRSWREPVAREQMPQAWAQSSPERGYSQRFAEGDDRGGLEQMAIAMSGNPYAQAAAEGFRYDTPLSPDELNDFENVRRKYMSLGGRDLANDRYDYDIQGASKAGLLGNLLYEGNNAHLPDTYKKPNHITFSDESIYSTPEMQGGQWKGERFAPSDFNLSQHKQQEYNNLDDERFYEICRQYGLI